MVIWKMILIYFGFAIPFAFMMARFIKISSIDEETQKEAYKKYLEDELKRIS